MPDDSPASFWAAVGTIIAGIGAAAVAWFRAGKTAARTERRDAMHEWQKLYDHAIKVADENRAKLDILEQRVDDCEAKHQRCEEQHDQCERNLAEMKHRLDSLESTVSHIKP